MGNFYWGYFSVKYWFILKSLQQQNKPAHWLKLLN